MKIRVIKNPLPLAAMMVAGLVNSAMANFYFLPGTTYQPGKTSPQPICISVADVNGDGKLDLISANNNEGTITVLTNNSSSGFVISTNLSLPANTYPQFVVAADLKINGNGKPDIISANYAGATGTATIWTNNGSGKFGSSSTVTVGQNPYCIAVADVNGDGLPDLISADYSDNTLTIMTNNGHGAYGLHATLNVGNSPAFVAAADVNGDGKVDLVCANYGDGTLTVLTNNNYTSFVLCTNITVGSSPLSEPQCVTVADVNGDAKPDLISANYSDGTLTILTNTGNGQFSSSTNICVGDTIAPGVNSSFAYYVAAADLSGKGKLDLISANSNDNTLSVLTNNGSGIFGVAANLPVDSSPQCVVAADFNNDGRADLASANYGGNGSLSVLLQVGPPTLKLSMVPVSGTNRIVLSWSSIMTNFVLQTSVNPMSPNWQSAAYPINVTSGTNMSTTITSTPPDKLFFRLVTP